MSFCPYMSTGEKKAGCDDECVMYLSKENGFMWNNKPWCGCWHKYAALRQTQSADSLVKLAAIIGDCETTLIINDQKYCCLRTVDENFLAANLMEKWVAVSRSLVENVDKLANCVDGNDRVGYYVHSH